MTKRLLLLLGAMFALAGIIYAGAVVVLLHGLTTADPFPPFMADYHRPRFYADLESSFDQFVTQRFPVGSNAQMPSRRSVERDSVAAVRGRICTASPGSATRGPAP